MPLPGWFTHAASFCVGAAATAAGVLLQSSRSSHASSKSDGSSATSGRLIAPPHIDDADDGDDDSSPLFTAPARRMLPSLPVRLFQPNENLVIAFDTRNKNPLFVMERLVMTTTGREQEAASSSSSSSSSTTTATVVASRKNKRFHEESTLLPYHRSRNGQYRHSGYDRGHLAPAADFSSSDDDMNDTFALTNVSPQMPRFNRTTWLRMEEFVRAVAKREGSGGGTTMTTTTTTTAETWVITGPLFLPTSATKTNDAGGGDNAATFRYSYEGIGNPPSLVSVPTHFYKVVVVVEKNAKKKKKKSKEEQSATAGGASSSPPNKSEAKEEVVVVLKKFGAFVLANEDTAVMGNRLADHIVRLTDLEAVTGMEFFPALFGGVHVRDSSGADGGADGIPLRKEIADALTDDVRFNNSRTIKGGGERLSGDDTNNALVPSTKNGEEWSKGRRRRVRQILRENSPVPFEHLCRKNDDCFRLVSAAGR